MLAQRTAKLGPDHLDTVATKDMLAALKVDQGQARMSAKRCVRKCWRSAPRNWGADHPDTLASQHRLAALYLAQGKTDLAETLFKEVLASRTAKLGADHPDTLGSRSDLAVLYFRQGKYALAETQYKEVLAIRSTKLGPNHRETINSQAGLAVVYRCMKKPDQAIPLLEEAFERSRANKYPVTSEMQAELGAVYCDAGRFADADSDTGRSPREEPWEPRAGLGRQCLADGLRGRRKKSGGGRLGDAASTGSARAASGRQPGAGRRAGAPRSGTYGSRGVCRRRAAVAGQL